MNIKSFFQITLNKDQENVIQNLEDFLESKDSVFILKGYAGTGKTTLIKGLVKALDNEKKKFSQFLIKSNQIKKTVRLYIPKDKYELYTSDPEDKKMFNEWYFKNSNLFSDYKNAIESYARIKHHDLH